MLHDDYPQADARDLERTVQLHHVRERGLAIVALVLTAGVAYAFVGTVGAELPWVTGAVFIAMLLWFWFISETLEGTLLANTPEELLGPYSVERIEGIVDEVRVGFREHEFPSVFIVDTKEAQAATVNVEWLNFVKRWNALYISAPLLHSLEEDELKAVLSHEMSHFSEHMPFWSRYFFLKPLVSSLWMTVLLILPSYWLFTTDNEGIALLWLVILLFLKGWKLIWNLALILYGMFAALFLTRPDEQEQESLCDFAAAKRYGVLSMSNALLKVASRQEVFHQLIAHFQPEQYGGEKPEQAEKLDEKLQTALAYLEDHKPLGLTTLEQSRDLIAAAVSEAGLEDFALPEHTLLRWLDHDVEEVDHRLNPQEYARFIEALEAQPEMALFYIPEELDAGLAAEAVHPTYRNRILFLEHNRKLGLLEY